VYIPFAQLFPVPVFPEIKLSGLKNFPSGPALIVSSIPGSRSIKIALGTYFLLDASL